MWSRRQFLARGTAVSFTLIGGPWVPPTSFPASRAEGDTGKLTTQAARKAIESGFKFLADKQREDGSFGNGSFQGNVGITSLAALAFVADGHQPDASARGKVISKAVDFILSQENPDGAHPGYLHNPHASPHGPMYNHGFGTLLLAHLHGKMKDKKLGAKLGEVLGRAVQLIVSSQNETGGWRYQPASKDADISVTTCQMMALAAAKHSGVAVPNKAIEAGVSYVKKCFDPASGGFKYMAGAGASGNRAFARTAASVAVLLALGMWKGDEIKKGSAYLIANPPARGVKTTGMGTFYGYYYAARALHSLGGKVWTDWYASVRKEVVDGQGSDGSWQDVIDPHYATALACLVLLTPEGRLAMQAGQKRDE
jgi:hypothetical protein